MALKLTTSYHVNFLLKTNLCVTIPSSLLGKLLLVRHGSKFHDLPTLIFLNIMTSGGSNGALEYPSQSISFFIFMQFKQKIMTNNR